MKKQDRRSLYFQLYNRAQLCGIMTDLDMDSSVMLMPQSEWDPSTYVFHTLFSVCLCVCFGAREGCGGGGVFCSSHNEKKVFPLANTFL